MTWRIRMIERPTSEVGTDGKNGFERLEIGDAWFAPYLLNHAGQAEQASKWLSPNYHRDWAGKRLPIVVALPWRNGPGIGSHFCVDGAFWRNGKPYGDGWAVTGEAPLLTLSPSVDIMGSYHGFIRDGVIGPDLERP